jgi:hypothetical protein
LEMTLANDRLDPSCWVFHGVWRESEEEGSRRTYEWWGELKAEEG